MLYQFNQRGNGGCIKLLVRPEIFVQNYYEQLPDFSFHTIAWNRGAQQMVSIDGVSYAFNTNAVLPIMLNQSFAFEKPDQVIAWQFNRAFYCILHSDPEVSCVGFLFFGPSPTMFLELDEEMTDKLNRLYELFLEEFKSEEEFKDGMLKMLLVRLIIQITRLAKKQYLSNSDLNDDKYNLIRNYHVLVETHFKTEKQIKFYASQLNRSPKTISNLFNTHSKQSPQQIIHERLLTEAKRLFQYTDKSVKEIADELGFEDASHFSKFFKSKTSVQPSQFKKLHTIL